MSTIVADYPPALETIVMKALARDVEQRFKSAQELQGQLEDFAHENRLRISPLVLARLMSTLYPARLEEWDHARAQGGFFVEQHVVRTLIASSKTSDNTNVARVLAVGLAIAADEETTAVTALAPMENTGVGAVPLKPEAASPFFEDSATAADPNVPSLTQTLAGPGPAAPSRRAAATPLRSHAPRAPTPIPGGVPITIQVPAPLPPPPTAPALTQLPAGGGALLVAGVVWYATRGDGERPTQVTGWITSDGGGVAAAGRF